MKRFAALVWVLLFGLGVCVPRLLAGVPVQNRFTVSFKLPDLVAGRTYAFTFGLYDASTGGNRLFEETASYTLPASKVVNHALGSANLASPMRAENFLQQLWVEVRTRGRVYPRVRLSPAPLAIGSQNSDQLDGMDSTDFALAGHAHGGAGSGIDADLLDGQHGSFYLDAGNLMGTLSDSRLSAAVDLRSADQTVTGLKTFDPQTAPGTPPFAVDPSNGGVVANLNADLLDGQQGSFYQDAANLTAGTLSADRFSARADLAAEGHLDNAGGDLSVNNGTLQVSLFAERAQVSDGLGAAALAALDLRYGHAQASQGIAGFWTKYTADAGVSVGEYSSITIGVDGFPIISSLDVDNQNLKVAHCGSPGCSFGNTATTIDNAGDVGQYTSITIGADGVAIVSYRSLTNGDLKILHCGNLACSIASPITTVDGADNVGEYTSIAIDPYGLPVVAYRDVTNLALKVLRCGNTSCTFNNNVATVDGSGDAGWDASIAIGADGLPVISYRAAADFDLRVLHCGNGPCTAGNTITTVDSGGDVGEYSSIAIGADGLPVVSYYDRSNGDLKVLHCGNATCSAGNTVTTVESAGNVGAETSITIGADGLPLISYRELLLGDLKVLRCGNTACTAGNTAVTIDSAGDTGRFSSITIGADGLPVVSYHDATSGDLKVARLFFRAPGRR